MPNSMNALILDLARRISAGETIDAPKAVNAEQFAAGLPKYHSDFSRKLREKLLPAIKEEEFVTPLSAQLIANMRLGATKTNIPATHIIAGSEFFQQVLSSKDLQSLFDPVCKYCDVISGFVGTMFGLDVIIDSYDYPDTRILPKGFLAVVALANPLDANIGPEVDPDILDHVSTLIA